MNILELLKVILFGIVEGITEFLPISSTGHMILLEDIVHLNVSDAFMEMFRVVIQLGAILAVCVIYFDKLNPFSRKKSQKQRSSTWKIWFKVVIGCIPAMIFGLLLDDWFDTHFYNGPTVAVTLILYGVLFIVIERWNAGKEFTVQKFSQLSYFGALAIGIVQVLALVPGTSRSGATILGAMLFGVSRQVAAEFSFFMSIPIMFGASLIKLLGFGFHYTQTEVIVLLVGLLVSFLVAVAAIQFLMGYIKKHDFKIFGVYRIVLGVIVLVYFLVAK